MSVDLLLGLQWGDEGKGKIVDILTSKYDIIARFQGGPNAGHTLQFDNVKHVLHTIPSGIFHKNSINIIGNGVVIDPIILNAELDKLKLYDIDIYSRLYVSRKAHLILPTHKLIDTASEISKGRNKIGSTLKGIGPTYMDKTGRNGLRVGDIESENFEEKLNSLMEKHKRMIDFFDVELDFDLDKLKGEWLENIELLKQLTLIDSEIFIHEELKKGKKILAEGAQGFLLDIDFGTYPFVTSSNTMAAGACTGLGIAPNKIKNILGVFKAYTTRVGSGPFPTELIDDHYGKKMAEIGKEVGATTGRARRCGWLDLPALKYAVALNGVTELFMMKVDVLSCFETIKVCTHYNYKREKINYLPYSLSDMEEDIQPVYREFEGWGSDITNINEVGDLPENLKIYISYIEQAVEVPIKIISVGPNRTQTIFA
ncbi:adenylosuccinate synthase [Ichthyobacterium seriolicida]|uniref:Adenylosuccinate synthetase n=1 Tax=Ichthyobacterium seriolicida TaxID=242600 RepID=A0A1J1DXE4_9FLAO|nr:adenylosuccinate synthase [Ichthyobacterium seriolicida]BAV94530.1 adenylosuccinate synthetase [Ichthyobacterium seriolicida]